MVALMDVPSDCKNSGEMGVRTKNGKLYKMSPEQAEDIRSVAAYLKQIDNRPVWVMGTSRGTSIREIYREVPAPASSCAAPDNVVGVLQGGIDNANAAASGEPRE